MKKTIFTLCLMSFSLAFLFVGGFSADAESAKEIYAKQERLLSIKQTANTLLYFSQGNSSARNSLEQVIALIEEIEAQIEERIEESGFEFQGVVTSFQNMLDLDSYSIEWESDYDYKYDNSTEEIEADISANGRFDLDLENKNFFIGIEEFKAGVDGGEYIILSGSIAKVGERFFGKLNNLVIESSDPEVVIFAMPIEEKVNEYKGKDILLGEITEIGEEFSIDSEDFDLSKVSELIDYAVEQSFVSGFFEVEKVTTDRLDRETVNKASIIVDYEELPDLIEKIVMKSDEIFQEDSGFTDADKEQIRNDIDELEKIELVINVWYDDDYIRKIEAEIDGEYEIGFVEPVLASIEGVSTIYLNNFNEDLNIEAPEEYISLEEIINEVMGGFEVISDDAAHDAERKMAIAQIRSTILASYDSNYLGMTLDVIDVPTEVQGNPIRMISSTDGFCASIQLSDGSHWCTDDSIMVGESTGPCVTDSCPGF